MGTICVDWGMGVIKSIKNKEFVLTNTVLMSLWKVPDEETRQLMVDFYQKVKAGEGKAKSLQEAELSLMRERRDKYGAAHPFFWGSFVCVGEP